MRRRRGSAGPDPTRRDHPDDGATRPAAGQRAVGNIAATFGHGTRRPYKHHDLGFVVDLGGWQAAANPLQVPLSGLAAKTVTRGYHLLSLPGNRGRTTADWITEAILPRQAVQLGLVHSTDAALNTDQPSA
jgi:NADH:ubiquinone reductase (H+-translocating)